MLRHPAIEPGLTRRIYSGSLLQFFTRDDFRKDGVPQLGFYGQFLPLVQPYSCAESPFWLSKIFLCLTLPKEHPFWTEKEQNGSWESIGKTVREAVLDGPGIAVSNHGENGAVVLRTAKVTKGADDIHGMWNYCKLCYASAFPWDSGVLPKKLGESAIESQQYVLHDSTFQKDRRANAVFYCGVRGGVLYRRQIFSYDSAQESHWRTALNLADICVPLGILRVDKVRWHQRPASLTLGAYGFPDNGTKIRRERCGGAQAVILSGHDHTGKEKQLAMTIWDGFDDLEMVKSHGSNPDSPDSILVYAKRQSGPQYAYEPYVLISQVITKDSLVPFTEEELFPLLSIQYADKACCGGYGPVRIQLKNSAVYEINYDEIEGRMQL